MKGGQEAQLRFRVKQRLVRARLLGDERMFVEDEKKERSDA